MAPVRPRRHRATLSGRAIRAAGAVVCAGIATLCSAALGYGMMSDETLPRTFADSARHYAKAFRRPVVQRLAAGSQEAARVTLGEALFFDPRLSRSGMTSCASCHNPSFGWSDGLPRAVGADMKVLGRRTPTIIDSKWASALFWDGRAETLEEQALGPITAPGEMNLSLHELQARLRAIDGYRPMFAKAFPTDSLGPHTIASAIAAFERTVTSERSPFDRWVDGEASAISPAAVRGFVLFAGKARCAACHAGWRLTDDSFHDIGVAGADSGRGAVIPVADVAFAFKTPTLRGIATRTPYMHDGSERTLEGVIDLYDKGGRVRRPTLSSEIAPLGLSAAEKRALITFLQTLGGSPRRVTLPLLPR